jgi:hypothetical protein
VGCVQVSAHYVFQHGALSTRLTPNHHYLRKIDRVLDANGRKHILELVYQSAEAVSMAAQTEGDSGDLSDETGVANTALRGRGHDGRWCVSVRCNA